MAKLTEPVKDFIVRELAAFSTPSEVAELVREQYDGLVITRQQVHEYDPCRTSYHLGKRWKVLHEKYRKAFLAQTDDIPIANKAFRLKKIQGIAAKAEKMGNLNLALQAAEQAAKEVGDVYTNRHKVDANVSMHEAWLSKLPPA